MDQIICSIQNDQDYEQRFQIFNRLISQQSGTNSKKAETIKLLQCVNDIVTSEDYEPKTKYYAILIVKDFFLKKYSVFVSSLSSSALLQNMTKMAKTIDPKKPMNQKGLYLFPDKSIGNKLMVLILECIVKWSEKYPANKSSQQPTKYKLACNELIADGVVLPDRFDYFPNFNLVNSLPQPTPAPTTIIQSNKIRTFTNPSQYSNQNDGEKYNLKDISNNLKLSLNKIEGFLAFLRDIEDKDEAEREIKRYHRQFQEQNRQYEQMSNNILDQNLLDDQQISLLFLMTSFYNNQNDFFKTYLQNDNDLRSYINQIILSSQLLSAKLADTNYQPTNTRGNNNPLNKLTSSKFKQYKRVDSDNVRISKSIDNKPDNIKPNQNEIKPRVYESFNRPDSGGSQNTILNQLREAEMRGGYGGEYVPSYQYEEEERDKDKERNYNRKKSENQRERGRSAIKIEKKQVNPTGVSKLNPEKRYQRNSKLEDQAEQGAMMIKQIFGRSHHPHSSFVQLRKDLQKQRTFKSKNTGNKSKTPNRSVSRNKSYIPIQRPPTPPPAPDILSRISIFKLHSSYTPNKPLPKTYSGTLIQQSAKTPNLTYQLQQINKNQSLYRFKICSLKQKYLLFENQSLQIGFNTEQIYRSHPKHPSLLSITLFLGNTTDDSLTDISISFQGDKTNSIYASPLRIPKQIDNKMQVKQNLLVVPVEFPFNLLNFKVKYKRRGKMYRVNVFLPYVLLKFCKYQRVQREEWKREYQRGGNTQLRSEVFQLSKQFPPSILSKYIPNLVQLGVGYREFIQQQQQEGKYLEYELGMKVVIMGKWKCLVGIVVRPDMSVVVKGVSGEDERKERKEDKGGVGSKEDVLKELILTIKFILKEEE